MITIQYDGEYPNLCRGTLVVTVEDKEWEFPDFCLSSGGGVWFDDNYSEHVDEGPWSIGTWPEDFPEEMKGDVLSAINDEVEHGCCGGCV